MEYVNTDCDWLDKNYQSSVVNILGMDDADVEAIEEACRNQVWQDFDAELDNLRRAAGNNWVIISNKSRSWIGSQPRYKMCATINAAISYIVGRYDDYIIGLEDDGYGKLGDAYIAGMNSDAKHIYYLRVLTHEGADFLLNAGDLKHVAYKTIDEMFNSDELSNTIEFHSSAGANRNAS